MKEIAVYALHIARKAKIIGTIVIVTTIVSLGLNLLLIPVWDVTGCAVATLLSQLFYVALVLFYAQKNYSIPYEYRKLAMLFLTGVLLSFSALLLNNMGVFPRVSLKIIVFAGFPFLLYILRFYEEAEIMAIRGFIRKWGNPVKLRDNLRSLKNIEDIKE
jgi:Na+-driven multidrug efflux pump